ncbi:formate dehydrogenase accessory sulfurtransferase FdhD [Pseudoxanthomonas daejeonensis]|uniref:formate dehydrogenase accessory sulfurtransferase FdhD n=1 Tax=Pseudoxanthomonas daejeonensis TaxID=266062 RepID=UPI001F543309|nr:formate dehydrogenase accessory sulfurtransferase FdhD [Pseudoxanthomonas daejeonensis]UNK56861.1 formate dehydrogenase accessory sulfurtransferase FdhD [Pseudoxanthomonas daejeonensis]
MPPDPQAGRGRRTVTVHGRDDGGRTTDGRAEDWLAEEAPVEVRYNGEPFAVMMATPVDLEDFAWGFSLSEGRVDGADRIDGVDVQARLEGFVVDIDAPSASPPEPGDARLLPGRSGCGLCGSRRLEEVLQVPARVSDGPLLDSDALQRACMALEDFQPLNASTGAMHAAAWASTDGRILRVREDVGRHNALDKLLGSLVREGVDLRAGFVLVSSRASYEMVTKAARLGVGVLAAVSAPTALAVDLARACGLTLAGFVRPGRQVIYSHPQRLDV